MNFKKGMELETSPVAKQRRNSPAESFSSR